MVPVDTYFALAVPVDTYFARVVPVDSLVLMVPSLSAIVLVGFLFISTPCNTFIFQYVIVSTKDSSVLSG